MKERRSFTNKFDKIGPKLEHWGTPEVRENLLEENLL